MNSVSYNDCTLCYLFPFFVLSLFNIDRRSYEGMNRGGEPAEVIGKRSLDHLGIASEVYGTHRVVFRWMMVWHGTARNALGLWSDLEDQGWREDNNRAISLYWGGIWAEHFLDASTTC